MLIYFLSMTRSMWHLCSMNITNATHFIEFWTTMNFSLYLHNDIKGYWFLSSLLLPLHTNVFCTFSFQSTTLCKIWSFSFLLKSFRENLSQYCKLLLYWVHERIVSVKDLANLVKVLKKQKKLCNFHQITPKYPKVDVSKVSSNFS